MPCCLECSVHNCLAQCQGFSFCVHSNTHERRLNCVNASPFTSASTGCQLQLSKNVLSFGLLQLKIWKWHGTHKDADDTWSPIHNRQNSINILGNNATLLWNPKNCSSKLTAISQNTQCQIETSTSQYESLHTSTMSGHTWKVHIPSLQCKHNQFLTNIFVNFRFEDVQRTALDCHTLCLEVAQLSNIVTENGSHLDHKCCFCIPNMPTLTKHQNLVKSKTCWTRLEAVASSNTHNQFQWIGSEWVLLGKLMSPFHQVIFWCCHLTPTQFREIASEWKGGMFVMPPTHACIDSHVLSLTSKHTQLHLCIENLSFQGVHRHNSKAVHNGHAFNQSPCTSFQKHSMLWGTKLGFCTQLASLTKAKHHQCHQKLWSRKGFWWLPQAKVFGFFQCSMGNHWCKNGMLFLQNDTDNWNLPK